ncbi:MAG: hypothetical protein GY743_03620 [Planctomycetaceae bacterium]|nr:hypothetical protein [Planctomycetaceae bacterium]
MLADKGYVGADFTQEMAIQGIKMHTPLRDNMKDERPHEMVKLIMDKRRYIETIIGNWSNSLTWCRIKRGTCGGCRTKSTENCSHTCAHCNSTARQGSWIVETRVKYYLQSLREGDLAASNWRKIADKQAQRFSYAHP